MTNQRGRTNEQVAARRAAVRQVEAKRAFWRQVSFYSVINLAFWLSWIIAGLREEWVAPWPLLPTAVWGAIILYRQHQLGGRDAIRHDTIAHEVAELRSPTGPVYRDRIIKRPIRYGDSAAYRPIEPFHLQDVIDARRVESQPESGQVTRRPKARH